MLIISSPIIIIKIIILSYSPPFPHLLLIISRLIVLACGCLPLPVKSDTRAGFCPRLEVVMRKRSGNLVDDQLRLYTCILHTLIPLLSRQYPVFKLYQLRASWYSPSVNIHCKTLWRRLSWVEKGYEIAQKKKREQNRGYQLVQVIYQICSARGTIHNEICLKKRITWSVLVLNLLRQVFKACTEAKKSAWPAWTSPKIGPCRCARITLINTL